MTGRYNRRNYIRTKITGPKMSRAWEKVYLRYVTTLPAYRRELVPAGMSHWASLCEMGSVRRNRRLTKLFDMGKLRFTLGRMGPSMILTSNGVVCIKSQDRRY